MKAALVIARIFPPQVGGSGRFLWEIYRRQPPGEYCIAAGEAAESARFDAACPASIVRLPLNPQDWGIFSRSFASYAGNFLRLAKLARRKGVRAIHSATLLPEGYWAWLLSTTLRLPYLTFVHGEDLAISASSRQFSWMARKVLSRSTRVIANSENTRRILLDNWPVDSAKIVVITPGVDIQSHRPAAQDGALRAALGWTGRRVVLSAGRLQERKGHDHLLRALPAIRQAIPSVLYSIVGEGERDAALRSLTISLGLEDCVQFIGAVLPERLIQCYQQCDLLALPNREVDGDFEGFGMVLVEAQACGRPVLAGTSGGTAETLRDGVTGRLVDCSTPEPLAAALIEMLESPAELDDMGRAAREWAVQQFDWENLAVKARRVFDDLAVSQRGA